MTKTNINVPNTLTTSEQLKRLCEYKAEEEKEEQEIKLIQKFMDWFNNVAKDSNFHTFLKDSSFSIDRCGLPDEFWNTGSGSSVLVPILEKYLRDSGWYMDTTSSFVFTFRPL